MKVYVFLAVVVSFAYGCNGSSNNAVKEADRANNERIDSTNGATAQAAQQKNDADFLVFATNVGMFEIEAAKLAGKNSMSKSVKNFAEMMINDRTELGKTVSALAAQKGDSLPSAISPDLQKEWNKLDSLKGKKFDEEYIDANVKGHTDAIARFESVANSSDYSAEVKQLAATALPKLREHKEHAEMLQAGNKKSSS
jgi:putative membrane protein